MSMRDHLKTDLEVNVDLRAVNWYVNATGGSLENHLYSQGIFKEFP